jgi:hypothetical protein
MRHVIGIVALGIAAWMVPGIIVGSCPVRLPGAAQRTLARP